jgi:hypothetical protein
MKIRVKVSFLLLTFILLIHNLGTSSAVAEEWQRVPHSYPNQAYVFNTVSQYIEFSDGVAIGSSLIYNKPMATGSGTISVQCESFQSANCVEALPTQLEANLTFPKCNDSQSTWCVSKVFIYGENSQPAEAEFVKYIDGNTFESDKTYDLPIGGTISLWRIKESDSTDQLLFAVDVNQRIKWTPSPYYYQLTGGIYPVTIKTGSEYFPEIYSKNDKSTTGSSYQISPKCEKAIFTSKGECGSKSLFPKNYRFGLSIVVPQSVNGFISGRLEEAKFSINSSQGSSTNKTITIDAKPMKIPRLGVVLTKEQALQMVPGLGDAGMNWFAQDNRQDKDMFKRIDFLRDIVGDKASGFSTVWNFTNLSSNNAMSACPISNNTFPGLISTNAMIMSPNPPVFKDSEFSYQVAGMHFEPDGKTLIVGNYTMIISKDIVSCLYGSTQIPIMASVSIINSETGDKKVSLSTLKNDGKFYTLNISGFNFSNPEIRVKLQFPEIKMEITKKSITCVKGKIKKNISGINPKCPTGYKISK